MTGTAPVRGGRAVTRALLNVRWYLREFTGEARWDLDLEGAVHASPTVASGVLYVGTAGGTIYAVGMSPAGSTMFDGTAGSSVVGRPSALMARAITTTA